MAETKERAIYKRKKYDTTQPNQAKRNVVSTLSSINTMNQITISDQPYIHNNVDMFYVGYKTIRDDLNYTLNRYFHAFIDEAKEYGLKMKKYENEVLNRLGISDINQLNQIFEFFSNIDNFNTPVVQLINSLRMLKNSYVEVNKSNLSAENAKQKLHEFFNKQIDVIGKNLNQITDSQNLLEQTRALHKRLQKTEGKPIDFFIGDAYEGIFALWLQEIDKYINSEKGQNKLIEIFGKSVEDIIVDEVVKIENKDQHTNTSDISVIFKKIEEIKINLSLKTGQEKYDYIDVFTDSRGYKKRQGATKSDTKYSIKELKTELNSTEYGYLIYALSNYKVLNTSQSIVKDTLNYLSYGLAWKMLLEAVFGTNFTSNVNNGTAPLFIVTLNKIYSIADTLLYIANFQYDDIGGIITKPENNKNNRYLIQNNTAKSKMKDLNKMKNNLLTHVHPKPDYVDLYTSFISDGILQQILNPILNDLTYQVKYRIQMDNFHNMIGSK